MNPADKPAAEDTSGIVATVDLAAEAGRAGFYERARAENLAPLWRVLHGLVPGSGRQEHRPAGRPLVAAMLSIGIPLSLLTSLVVKLIFK